MNNKNKWLAPLLMAMMLAGCANDQPHRLDLINDGSIEDGLAQLQQATREHPDKTANRADYLRERDRAVNYLLLLGDRMHDQGRAAEASAYYRRVLVIDPENTRARDGIAGIETAERQDAMLVAARALFDKGDLDGAQARLQAIFAENLSHFWHDLYLDKHYDR